MNLRATKPKLRVALALALFFACAFVWNTDVHVCAPHRPEAGVPSGPSPYDLPNDCGITAAEAASRLQATGAWVRVLCIDYQFPGGPVMIHAVTVWQMPSSTTLLVYDVSLINGSVILDTRSHDCKKIAKDLAHKMHMKILKVRFI